jgi:hypothetical protein
MRAFTIRHAKTADFERLYEFVFDKPNKNIRKRPPDEVEKLIDEGAFFIAINDETGRIVGCCYVHGLETDKTFEFGGAFVEEEHRKHGIFWCVGLGAILSHFANNPETPLMAHVVTDNAGPVSQLQRLHFARTEQAVAVPKDSIPGLEHMDADANGNVHADIYEFQMDKRLSIIEAALELKSTVKGKDGDESRITFQLANFAKDTLEELAEYFSK